MYTAARAINPIDYKVQAWLSVLIRIACTFNELCDCVCVTPGPMISVADSWHAMYAIHGNQSSRFLLMLLLGPASVMALRAALASLCSDLPGLCLFSAFRFIAISATVSTGGPGGGPVGGPGMFLELKVAVGGIFHCWVLTSGL